MDSIRHLLEHAPADKMWRRRGFLVVCRAFVDKTRLGLASDEGVRGGIEATKRDNAPTRAGRVKVDDSALTVNGDDGDEHPNCTSMVIHKGGCPRVHQI